MSGEHGAFQTTAPYQFKEKEMNIFGHDFNVMSAVDLAQIAGRFLGRSEPRPVAAASGEKKEEPLKQQVASILPTRDDEAILIAIDAALANMPDGVEHLANVQLVREALEPHQRDDWRKNIGSIKMTERFENVIASETTTRNRGGQDQDDPALPQRRRGGRDQDRIERKFERRPIDYEWTDLDPRVRHLILISRIVTAPQGNATKAKDYLLSAGFIKKQSATQQTAAAAAQSAQSMTNTINRFVGNVRSDEAELVRIETALKANPAPQVKQDLEQQRNTYLAQRSREANAARKEKDQAATVRLRLYIIGFVVLVIIGITVA